MIDFLVSNAVAQSAAGQVQGAAQQNPIMAFMPFVLIFVVFYFLMIRPQKKKVQQEQKMINELERGVEIYTKSGLIGTITGVNDNIITLEVSEGVKIKVLKYQVGGPLKALLSEAKKEQNQKK